MSKFAISLAVLAALLIPVAAQAIDVADCAVTIPRNRVGTVTQDIACDRYCEHHPSLTGCDQDQEEAPCPDVGSGERCLAQSIVLQAGARLHLAGHTITGVHEGAPVSCRDPNGHGRCTVAGPGVLDGNHGDCVGGYLGVVVRRLTVQGGDVGISSTKSILATNVVIAGCDIPLSSPGRITQRHVTILP